MDVGKLELYRRGCGRLGCRPISPSFHPSIHHRRPHGSAPSGLPGTPRTRPARAAWRCQGEKADASWRRLAGRRRSHTAAPVHPPRLADGGKRHLGDGDAVGPTRGLARESPGRRSNKARRLCVARRRRGVVRWSEGEARWGRGHGDAPKPSIAAGAPGSDVTWRLPRRRLAWAQTEGIVEDVEPRTEND